MKISKKNIWSITINAISTIAFLSVFALYQKKEITNIAWIFIGWICGSFILYQIVISMFDHIWKIMGLVPPYSKYPKNFSELIYLLIYMFLFLVILYVPILLIIIKH